MSWDMNMEEKMSKVRRVYSEKMPAFAVKAKELSDEISNYLNINTVKNVRVLIRYDIENISDEVYKDALVTVFSEPPVDYVYEEDFGKKAGEKVFAVEFLPGQFDQRADSAVQCVKLLKEDAKLTDLNGVMRYIRIFSELSGQLKNSSQKRVMVEVALIKMTQPAMEKGLNDALMDRIAVLERRMETGLEAAARAMAAGGFAAGAVALTGDNGGMTADAAIGGTQTGMGTKPKPARSEDITAVIQNWRSICNGLSMSLKPILEHYTTKANGGGNKLQLIYEDATYYSMISRQEVIDTIKQAIAAKTGLDMEVEVIHVENGVDVSQEYDTLEDICRMNIVEEDF